MNYEQRLFRAFEELCDPRPEIDADQVKRRLADLKADIAWQLGGGEGMQIIWPNPHKIVHEWTTDVISHTGK